MNSYYSEFNETRTFNKPKTYISRMEKIASNTNITLYNLILIRKTRNCSCLGVAKVCNRLENSQL